MAVNIFRYVTIVSSLIKCRAVKIPCPTCQVENFNLLVLGQVQNLYKVNKHFVFTCLLIIMSSHAALKTVWILISWLHQKPADLEQHCLQES